MSRARLQVDVTVMKFVREQQVSHKAQGLSEGDPAYVVLEMDMADRKMRGLLLRFLSPETVRSIWADSSPQGGVDWLLCLSDATRVADLLELNTIVNELKAAPKATPEDLEEEFGELPMIEDTNRAEAGQRLQKVVKRHVHVPVGSGL